MVIHLNNLMVNGKYESELYDYKILASPDISYTEGIDRTFA